MGEGNVDSRGRRDGREKKRVGKERRKGGRGGGERGREGKEGRTSGYKLQEFYNWM